MIFTILYENYLQLVQKFSSNHSIKYQFCTAKLIHLFTWLSDGGKRAVQRTRKEIYELLLREHGKDAIAAGIKILEELDILRLELNDRKTNKRNGQSKTYNYWLNYERLSSLLGEGENKTLDGEIENSSGEIETLDGDCSPPYEDLPNTTLSTPTNTEHSGVEEETAEEESAEDIKAALADSPFMQEDIGTDSSSQLESSSHHTSSAAASESNNNQITIFHRLRDLGISDYSLVRSLIKETSPQQLERNLLALEEEAATKGLKKPLAAFISCVEDNWQPRNDKQTWWERAAEALGRERRDRLIAHVTELWGRVVVCFTNGRQIPLDEALSISWEALAQLGGGA